MTLTFTGAPANDNFFYYFVACKKFQFSKSQDKIIKCLFLKSRTPNI